MITTFVYTLAGGMAAILAVGRPDQIAWKFLRLCAAFVLALACVPSAYRLRQGEAFGTGLDSLATVAGLTASAAAVVLILLAPIAVRRAGLWRTLCASGGAAGMLAGIAVALTTFGESATVVTTVMIVISQVCGACVLGSITVAWLLGHAYLTATKMTIAPLQRFSRTLSWAMIVRWVFFVVSVTVAYLLRTPGEPSILAVLMNSWLVASLRIGVGLVAVGAFAYMVSDCVRLRSTQSATGILYFGSLFAYVGELAALQLLTECGWPT